MTDYSDKKMEFYDRDFENKCDSNLDLIGFENGVYDFKAKCFRKGLPEDYITLSTGYDYKEFAHDDEIIIKVRNYLKNIVSNKSVLTLIANYMDGHLDDQELIVWHGTDFNLITNLIQSVLGSYYDVLFDDVLTRNNLAYTLPQLSNKKGKRILVINSTKIINASLLKTLVGGDCIFVNSLYGDPFTYKPQFKLILASDKLPKYSSNDNATLRRLRIMSFELNNNDKSFLEYKQAIMWILLHEYRTK